MMTVMVVMIRCECMSNLTNVYLAWDEPVLASDAPDNYPRHRLMMALICTSAVATEILTSSHEDVSILCLVPYSVL